MKAEFHKLTDHFFLSHMFPHLAVASIAVVLWSFCLFSRTWAFKDINIYMHIYNLLLFPLFSFTTSPLQDSECI